ncbi:GL13223 [Mycolicibacterium thermoresistibile]|uniref:GL13223 n=1 Tax=Mycolicibacterium thermoresistibile TaxID=1797 RepID=A0A117ILG9_MYCTH|nr:GL13223 [Mycolicibacterium thermoresistibile]
MYPRSSLAGAAAAIGDPANSSAMQVVAATDSRWRNVTGTPDVTHVLPPWKQADPVLPANQVIDGRIVSALIPKRVCSVSYLPGSAGPCG